MGRTILPDTEAAPKTTRKLPQPKFTRTLIESVEDATRCHWKCPCGGTVPDAPSYCSHSYHKSTMHSSKCADVQVCALHCHEREVCSAYAKYRKKIKERREKDAAEASRRRRLQNTNE